MVSYIEDLTITSTMVKPTLFLTGKDKRMERRRIERKLKEIELTKKRKI